MTAESILKNGKEITEKRMAELLDFPQSEYSTLIAAMKYSANAGGKRLRPALLLEFYRLCGGKNISDAANFSAALEFIHTYSLIHDDLPCMDNDDMRRGKPSCHIKFGEDMALLAGDALLTLAFKAAADCKNTNPEDIIKAISFLSKYSGADGMIGGQVIDLAIENTDAKLETVISMYRRKTGALIVAAATIGCILAGADTEKLERASAFAENIGLAFQITDDILDTTSTSDELGKPVGSDDKNNKSTALSILGLNKSVDLVKELTDNAIEQLAAFGNEADGLKELALMLVNRKN